MSRVDLSISSAGKGNPAVRCTTEPAAVWKKFVFALALLPLLMTTIFSVAAFNYGTPGFRVDKTQQGLHVSKVVLYPNPIQVGDLITAFSDIPYSRVLGLLLLESPSEHTLSGTITVLRGKRTLTFKPAITPMSWPVYLTIAWPHLLLILLFLSLGSIALFQAPPKQPSAIFFFMLCSFATTIASTLPSHFGTLLPEIISLSFLSLCISNWFAFGAMAHFICRFPKERNLCTTRPWLAPMLYALPPCLALGSALFSYGLTDTFFSGLQRFRNLLVPVIISGSFIKHSMDLRHISSPSAKSQVKLSLAAYWLTFAPYLTLYLLPNLLFDKPLISFRLVLLAATILPAAYLIALLRYRLLGVDRLISRTISYFIVISILALSYSALLTILKRWFFGRQIVSEEIFLVFIITVALAINPFLNRIQRVIDRFFFRYRPNDQTLLFNFSQKLASTLQFSELTALITNELPQQIQVTGSALLLLNERDSLLYPEHLRIGSAPWPDSRLVRQFNQGEQVLFCHEEQADPQLNLELSQLHAAGFFLALPLWGGTILSGILLLGPRKDGRIFREHDIRLLATLANQIAVALKNSLQYTSLAESKEQLETLFSRVVQSEKMAIIGEMSTTLAHEIRNPLGIIRSSAQYLVEDKRPQAINQEMLHYIIDEVDGLNTVVTNILGLAKFKNPSFNPVDLQKNITMLCSKWRNSNDHNPNISIRCSVAERLPFLYADFQQLRQVLINLLRNSEEALMGTGTITLSVERKNEYALFRLQDDGPGITREHREDLFKKFFTTKQDGLGLGLSVCEQIIAAHYGTIIIRNRAQGGAEVLIQLPFQPMAIGNSES